MGRAALLRPLGDPACRTHARGHGQLAVQFPLDDELGHPSRSALVLGLRQRPHGAQRRAAVPPDEHESYRRLARRAAGFVALPIEEGGAQYEVLGFKLPAEYVYPSPPIPNVRVLDGELIVIAALFNVARLLGDSDLLRLFMTQVGSLAMQMESYRRPNGDLEFAMYIEDLPAHYRWDVWSALQILANASKDRRFSILARDFAKHVPDEWKESNGS